MKKNKFYPKRVNSIQNLYFLITGKMCFSEVDIIHNSVSREEARARCDHVTQSIPIVTDYVISNDRRISGTGNPLTKFIFSRKKNETFKILHYLNMCIFFILLKISI